MKSSNTGHFKMSTYRTFKKQKCPGGLVAKAFHWSLPRRVRRIAFIASVVAMLGKIDQPNRSYIEKLNKILALAGNADAIAYPMHIRSFIWKERLKDAYITVEEVNIPISELNLVGMDDKQIHALAHLLFERAPHWLLYGTERFFTRDLEKLLKHEGGSFFSRISSAL